MTHDKTLILAEYGWSTMSPLTSQVLKGNGLGLSDLSDITLLIFTFLFVNNKIDGTIITYPTI
jgi:hypothetical protein